MIEAAPAPAEGPALALARESGAALAGLRLADGALILKVERAGRAMQVRIADGGRFDAHGGSFVPSRSFGRGWPRLNATSPTQREFCRFSLFSTTQVIELLNPGTPNSPQYRL